MKKGLYTADHTETDNRKPANIYLKFSTTYAVVTLKFLIKVIVKEAFTQPTRIIFLVGSQYGSRVGSMFNGPRNEAVQW